LTFCEFVKNSIYKKFDKIISQIFCSEIFLINFMKNSKILLNKQRIFQMDDCGGKQSCSVTVMHTASGCSTESAISLPELCVDRCRYIQAQHIQDGNDGCLSILTSGIEVPFDIKRVYFINGFKEQRSVRGKHAHRNLDQALFCLSGNFVLSLEDGRNQQSLMLSASPEGVWIGRAVWHTMDSFSQDCVILVLANAPYDERDYIRDYDEFKKFTTDSAFL
jgi:hypothetical protein